MKALYLEQVKFYKDLPLERTFPKGVRGSISVKKGDKVGVFDVLGEGNSSPKRMLYKFEGFSTIVRQGDRVAQAEVLARRKLLGLPLQTLKAPFAGIVEEVGEGEILFSSVLEKFKLICGVEGKVDQVEDTSAVIKTEAFVVRGVFGSGETDGELTTSFKDQYITAQNLPAALSGKIVLCSGVSRDGLEKAKTIGVRGFIVGGISSKQTPYFSLPFVSLLGFGEIPVPQHLFKFLEQHNGKYIFLKGDESCIILPGSKKSGKAVKGHRGDFVQLKKGLKVLVFAWPYFGLVGKVTTAPYYGKLESGIETEVCEVEITGKKVVVPVRNIGVVENKL